jgi:integral membrane protein (TIGR01906 family)
VSDRTVHGLLGILVAAATILAIVGATVVLFLNPVWVGFGQARTEVTAWTGWTSDQVTETTNAILRDLVIGPPEFAMTVDGTVVFDEREREHLRDVRRVLVALGLAVLVAIVILVVTWRRSRGASWFWRSVGSGAVVLAGSVVFLGAFFALSFDTAFELFHRLFFAGGTYTFDPATERLVQLFPERFWYETTVALGVVLLVASVAVAWVASRRADRTGAEGAGAAGTGAAVP